MTLTLEERDAIALARKSQSATRRPTVTALEDILFEPVAVLDHGFLRVLDYMGDDAAVVQAARVSYGRGTRQVNEDRALIRYLMRHDHTTPFEMAEIKFHVKLPIFVARQWIRHRTASVNEYSARYSILDKEFYVPAAGRLAEQSSQNRQGPGSSVGDAEANQVLSILRADAERCFENYAWMLNEGDDRDPQRRGLARELARINLTLSTYTQWYWKIDLHNLLHFVQLRASSDAQHEIRVYADAILKVLKVWVPLTYEALIEYRLGAFTLSRSAVSVISRLLAGHQVNREASNLSSREWNEIERVFGLGCLGK